MFIIFLALGICGFLIVQSIRFKVACDRYAFENRSSGGVVQFKTFEESKTYERRRNFIRATPMMCIMLIIGSIAFYGKLYG